MSDNNFDPKNSGLLFSNQSDEESNELLNTAFKQAKVQLFQIKKTTKTKEELGTFYRIEKTFFYKERIMVLYLLDYLIYWGVISAQKSIKDRCKIISNIFYQSIKIFEKQLLQQYRSCTMKSPIHSEILKMQQAKQSLIKLLETILQNKNGTVPPINSQQIQFFLDILLSKWVKGQNIVNGFFDDVGKVFNQEITIQKINRQQKITQLTVLPINSNTNLSQKHLLYKNFVFKYGQNKFVQIIETNQEKFVFFNFFMPKLSKIFEAETRSKISELFEEKDRKEVYQSEDDNSQSDKKSQIVKDEQFYRITSKIQTSMRKNSFNQGQNDDGSDSRYINFMYDSINPGLSSEYKVHNPVSEIYTRSSSLQKGNFPYRDNLSTSIDLLMRLQLETLNRRKKSCQNVRTYQKSVEKGEDRQLKQRMSSKLKINLYNEDRANLYCGNFQPLGLEDEGAGFAEAKRHLGSNRRLGIARSFFRHNQAQIKD